MRLDSIPRLYHTVRHLRPGQIVGRATFHLRRPRIDRRPAPALRPVQDQWTHHVWRQPSLIGSHTFSFLNQKRSLGTARDWNHPGWEKLWLYNLHYFDDLSARDGAHRVEWQRALIERWIAENPPAEGNGWEPYPMSLRIANWIKWSLAGNALEPHWRDSLALQLRVLAQRLEWHLLGNHLLANAKALMFGGLFFSGRDAERWRESARRILADQLPEQILGDGGHFERSPMYHAIVLEDLLDLINLAQVFDKNGDQSMSRGLAAAVRGWRARVPRMLNWLRAMSHPDGEVGFFNDAAFGIAPRLSDLERYADQLGLPVDQSATTRGLVVLDPTGYLRLALGPAVCLLDTAPVGPDYLPGHAHADTLSFECSIFGRRLVVNGGTSCYGASLQRLRERGTAAHSTVEIDGEDSSEVWGGFRVARRARPLWRTIRASGDDVEVTCAHDGYRRLPGAPRHQRAWRLSRNGLKVIDTIEGTFRKAVARFHLHPDVTDQAEGNAGYMTLAGNERIAWKVVGGQAALVPSSWHPEFGRSLPTRCLELTFTSGTVETLFTW